jgi:hypothetical protein
MINAHLVSVAFPDEKPTSRYRSQEINLQIVFEGTVRILRPRAESPGPMESRSGRSVAKRIQLRKVVGMSLAKAGRNS